MTTLKEWQEVPNRVAELLPQAMQLQQAYFKIAAQTGDLAGTTATWDTVDDVLILYRPKPMSKLAVDGGKCVLLRSRNATPDWDREILIKAAAIPVLGQAFDFGHKMLGGPTPLSNAIVSGAMLGGLGYGAGALAENLFPERYMQRGKLRRNLGLLGLGAGGLIGLNNAYAMSKRRPDIGFWKSWVTPNSTSIHAPGPARPGPFGMPAQQSGPPPQVQRRVYDINGSVGEDIHIGGIPVIRNFKRTELTPEQMQQINGIRQNIVNGGELDPLHGYGGFDPITPAAVKSGSESVKEGFQQFPSMGMHPSLFSPTVSVPQFNQAAWQDVQRGMYTGGSQFTPPAYAAAATGLMTGISTAQNSPIIRPVDVIRGIASAGVGLATANVAGRALSAMAGLTPAGQEKLQDMGLWGGMMHAIVPAMFR